MAKMYQIKCDPDCGFVATDHDREELKILGAIHAVQSHPDMQVTGKMAEDMITAV